MTDILKKTLVRALVLTFTFVLTLIFFFFSYLMLELSLPYLSFDNTVAFLRSKQDVIHLRFWRVAFYTHVFSSMFILVSGFFQFFRFSYKKYIKLHRFLGRVYVFLILCVSGPAGLIMAFYANGGVVARAGFVCLGIGWFVFTYLAFAKIRQKNIESHRRFMIRSYALTLSAITLRAWVFGFSLLGMDYEWSYIVVSWLAWLPNWAIAELIIHLKK